MRIFLSYPSEHREVADQIHLGLLGNGHEVFFDRDALPSGGNYNARIAAAVAQSDLMVFLVSNHSVTRGSYALTELKYARNQWPNPAGRVLPVMIEAVPLERLPTYLKAVTLLEPDGNVVAECCAAVASMVRERHQTDSGQPRGDLVQNREAPARKLWSGFMGLSWRVRTAVLLVTMSLALGALYAPNIGSVTKGLYAVFRVSLWNGKGMPLDAGVHSRVQGTISRLSVVVKRDVLEYQSRSTTPWLFSQGSLALAKADRVDPAAYAQFVRKNSNPACGCWTEYLDKPGDRCVFISGWVLATLARHGLGASPEELQFLLEQQHEKGWWSMFPVRSGAEFASPYATAWVLMGLHLQRSSKQLSPQQTISVDKAIGNGVAWLLSVRDKNSARWKRYPESPKSELSVSVSGTVMHALHMLDTPNLASIDALWLDSLPDGIAGEAENPYVIIETMAGQATDYWEQIKLPWVIAATIDAYVSGNLRQRVKALRWTESTLSDPRVLASDTEQRPWWRAELLYALRYALDERDPS